MRCPEVAHSGIRLARLAMNPEAPGGNGSSLNLPRMEGEPVHGLIVSGFLSPKSRDLGGLRGTALQVLPEGSTIDLHTFATGVNVSLVNFSIPGKFRAYEERRVGDSIKRVADTHGESSVVVGYSLGGIQAMNAGLENPDEVRGLVTVGSPFSMPGVGTSDRIESPFRTVVGDRDKVVPDRFSRHGKADSRRTVKGGHLSLPVSRQGVTAIVEDLVEVINRSTPQKAMTLYVSSLQ